MKKIEEQSNKVRLLKFFCARKNAIDSSIRFLSEIKQPLDTRDEILRQKIELLNYNQ